MIELTFPKFQAEFFQRHNGQDYTGALSWLDQHANQFPERQYFTTQWRICAQTLSGQPEAALRSFQSALDGGFWWPADLMRNDPDLASLQDNPAFQELVDRCAALHEAAREGGRPELRILEPDTPDGQALPLLLVFHGRMGNAADNVRAWQSLVQSGWLVASAQSSQVMGIDAYGWDDWDLAREESRQHYERLCQQYTLDTNRLILGGFSQGGGLAAWLALSGDLPVKGFVGVAPYVPDFPALETNLDHMFHPAGGYLVTGDEDQGQEGYSRLETLLVERDLPVWREKHPQLAHEYPPDFDATLKRALKFLLKA